MVSSIYSTINAATTSVTARKGIAGLASGINTDEIIDLMTLGTRTKIAELQQKQTSLSWKMEAYQLITTAMLDFKNKYTNSLSATNMRDPSFFLNAIITSQGKNASAVSITGVPSAALSNFSVKSVDKLATTASFTSTKAASQNAIKSSDIALYAAEGLYTSGVEGGTINLRFDGVSHNIRIRNIEVDPEIAKRITDGTATADDYRKNADAVVAAIERGIKEAGLEGKIGVGTFQSTGRIELKVLSQGSMIEIDAVSKNVKDVLGIQAGDTGKYTESIKGTWDIINDVNSAKDTIVHKDFNEALKGSSIAFNLNGTSRTITFGDDANFLKVNDGSDGGPIVTAAQVLEQVANYLNGKLKDAFGMDASGTKQKVSVSLSDLLTTLPPYTGRPHPGSPPSEPMRMPVITDYLDTEAYDAAYAAWVNTYPDTAGYDTALTAWEAEALANYESLGGTVKPVLTDYLDQAAYDAALAAWEAEALANYESLGGTAKPVLTDYPDMAAYQAAIDQYDLVDKPAYDTALANWQTDYDAYLLANQTLIEDHANYNGELVFEVADRTSILSVAGGSSGLVGYDGAKGVLGINFADANRLLQNQALTSAGANLNKDVADLLDSVNFAEDGKVEMVVNGTTFSIFKDKIVVSSETGGEKTYEFKSGTSMRDIANTINNADVGVRISYNTATDNYSVIAAESGSMGKAEVSGEFAEALFGAEGSWMTKAGEDAVMRVSFDGGVSETIVTRSSNSFTLNGMNITLNHTFEGSSIPGDKSEDITFTSKPNTDVIVDAIKEMITAYNGLIDAVNNQLKTKPNLNYAPLTSEQRKELSESEIKAWEDKAKQGLLFGDPILRTLASDLQFAFSMPVGEASLRSIGILSGGWSEYGKLSIPDEAKLRQAIEADPEKVADIFTRTSSESITSSSQNAGLMARMDSVMEKYVNTIGTRKGLLITKAGHDSASLTIKDSELYKQFLEIEKQIQSFQARLATEQDRYIRQFTSLETYISRMNAQSNWLYSMLNSSEY